MTGRTCDFLDWLADGGGAATGVVLCNLARLAWSLLKPRQPRAAQSPDPTPAEQLIEQ